MAGIKVPVGVDTTGFERGLDRLAAQGNRFKATLERRFGLADVAKGFAQGLGIGSVQQIASLVSSFYESAAKDAERIEAASSRALDATLKAIGLRNSPEQNVAATRKRAGGLDRDISITRDTLNDLEGNPLNYATEGGRQQIAAQKQALDDLKAKQSELYYQADAMELQIRKRSEALQREKGALQDNIDVQSKGMSELQAAERELGRLRADAINVRFRLGFGDTGQNALDAANNAVTKQQSVVAGLKEQTKQRIADYFYSQQSVFHPVVADSLARVGGGGGTFGGGSPMYTEQQKQTAYLKEIALSIRDAQGGLLK